MSKGLKAVICVLLVLLGVLINRVLNNVDDDIVSAAVEKNETVTGVPIEYKPKNKYTKGQVIEDTNCYYNSWLNLCIDVPENYSEAEGEFYEEFEKETGDECGMYFVNDTGNSIAVCFTDISEFTQMSLENFLKTTIKESLNELSSYGQSYTYEEIISDFIIIDKTFKKARLLSPNITISMYAYKISDKICYITVSGNSDKSNDSLVLKFKDYTKEAEKAREERLAQERMMIK